MKRWIFLLISVLSVLPSSAHTMKEVFSEMPDSILPYIIKNRRLDCIDFIENNMKAEVENELNGKSELLSLTDSTLEMRLSSISTLRMRLFSLPITDATTHVTADIECILFEKIIDTPEKQSFPRLFTIDWKELKESEENANAWKVIRQYITTSESIKPF